MNRMAIPFCLPHDDREEDEAIGEARTEESEGPDEYDSPDEDTGQHHYDQHYQRLEELMTSLYNVFRIVLLPPPPLRRRHSARNSGRRRQQVTPPGEGLEPRGALPRQRRQHRRQEESGDEELERSRETVADARTGRRRLSSRTVATETDEEPPRGPTSNFQLPSPTGAPNGARRSMSTSSTQCSYEDWAEYGDAGEDGVDGKSADTGEEEEEEEDDVFLASKPWDSKPSRPPSPDPPPSSSNRSGPGAGGGSRPGEGSRPEGGGVPSSRRQRRSGRGSSYRGQQRAEDDEGTKDEAWRRLICNPLSEKDCNSKMATPRKSHEALRRRSMEDWDLVSRELQKVAWEFSATFKQEVAEKTFNEGQEKELEGECQGQQRLTTIFSPLMPSASPGLWTLVAVCVGAQVIGRFARW